MHNLQKDLIKLADKLDRRGLFDLADDIDLIIKQYDSLIGKASWKASVKRAMEEVPAEELEIEVPEDEMEILQDVLKSLKNSLE